METTKSISAKIIKLAEFMVNAEINKKTAQQEQKDFANFDRTIDVSSKLIYDMLSEVSCDEREEIFYNINEYACAIQNEITTNEMWWLDEPVFMIEGPSQNITLNACKIVRPLYDEMSKSQQDSEATESAMR